MESKRQTVVITGGGRGLGAALARQYASGETRLLLIGRSPDVLERCADSCRKRGAEVHVLSMDITKGAEMDLALTAFDNQYPIDLVLANAGVSAGREPLGGLESVENARQVARVNFEGVINTIAPVAERMRQRGRGRVALVSSLAGLIPLPDSPSYSASKAGVISYGLALDTALRRHGVSVTVLCPGFIKSDMSDRYVGSKPLLMTAEQAAAKMMRWISGRRRLVAFPWPLAVAARAGNALPAFMREWLLQRVSRFAIQPEEVGSEKRNHP